MYKKSSALTNAAWLISSRIIQSLLAFVIGLLTARYLGPENFGLINYASSIVAFVLPMVYFGINNILVQELIATPEKEGELMGTSLLMGGAGSILCIGGILAFSLSANAGESDTILICALYSSMLVFQGIELIQYWFQAKLISRYMSVTMIASYLVVSGYKAFLLITAKGVAWFAISNALDHCIISITLLVIYKRLGGKQLSWSWQTARRLMNKGKYYIFSNMMVAVFAQTDRILLKSMVDTAAVGLYSAAITISNAASFVFSAIIDSMRPVIFECKARSPEKFELQISRLYAMIIYLSIAQSIAITLLADPLVRLMFGQAYLQAITPTRIVVWYTIFSYMGAVRNIWILAEDKQRYLWILNLSGVAVNIVLNLLLIPRWGIIGSASASLATQIFTNVLMNHILRPIRGNGRLIANGLNPALVLDMTKTLIAQVKAKQRA